MSTKHTPGPWVATPYGDVMPVGANFLVASCGGKSGLYRDYEANAPLIAAAPEMYAELLDILRSIEGGGDIVTFSAVDVERYRAVLAKATGEKA